MGQPVQLQTAIERYRRVRVETGRPGRPEPGCKTRDAQFFGDMMARRDDTVYYDIAAGTGGEAAVEHLLEHDREGLEKDIAAQERERRATARKYPAGAAEHEFLGIGRYNGRKTETVTPDKIAEIEVQDTSCRGSGVSLIKNIPQRLGDIGGSSSLLKPCLSVQMSARVKPIL